MFSNPFFQNYSKADASWEIIIMLLVAFLLGLLLGWLLFNRNKIIAALNEEITALKTRLGNAEASLGSANTKLEESLAAGRLMHSDLDACSDSKSKLYMKLADLENINTALKADLDISSSVAPTIELATPAVVPPVVQMMVEETPAPVIELSVEDVTPEIHVEAVPIVLAASPSSKGDNLKIVEGIGPVIERILKAGGIKTFTDLADASPDRIREILLAEGEHYRIHDPGTWPQQSALARDGKMDELKTMQDTLKSGK